MAIDPYRILGLPPGATPAEVKRAYRRLAKANHPDSAGAGALPRFLEIQRAYETLTSASSRPGQRRSSPGPGTPWQADPTRARATPGARPPGGTSGASARRPGSRPADGGAGASTRRPAGTGGTSSRTGPGTSRKADGASGRRRPSKKATFGSTTYDEAREQADTRWSGASWYGPSSGEYWRVNPREYADPRKHGPEYQARAAARDAAAAAGAAAPGSFEASADRSAPNPRHGTASTGDASRTAASGPPPGRQPGSRRAPYAGTAGVGAENPTAPAGVGRDQPHWTPPAERVDRDSGSGAGGPPQGSWPNLGITLSPSMRRIVRALIAWPPLGIAAAAVIGEATGCAAFEASCTAPQDLYPWFAQAAIIIALLLLSGVARILAGGTVAVVLLAFPVAAALSASGATYDRTYGPAALIAVLAVVWVLGVGLVLLRRAVFRTIP